MTLVQCPTHRTWQRPGSPLTTNTGTVSPVRSSCSFCRHWHTVVCKPSKVRRLSYSPCRVGWSTREAEKRCEHLHPQMASRVAFGFTSLHFRQRMFPSLMSSTRQELKSTWNWSPNHPYSTFCPPTAFSSSLPAGSASTYCLR